MEKNEALSTQKIPDPLVSIIIPVYNMEKYLRQCLDSVIGQTETNIEIICIDDGSSDSSFNILEEYRAKDSRIVVIKQENSGVSVARNVGVSIASGKYLFFADSDDELAPTLCQKTTEIADKYNAQILLTDPDNLKNLFFSRFPQFRRLYDPQIFKQGHCENLTTEQRRLLSYYAGFCACWRCLYRRDFWIEQNLEFPKDLRINEDLCVNLRAFAQMERIAFLNDNPYYYRIREDSVSHKDLGKRLGVRVDIFKMFQKTRDYYVENAPNIIQPFIETFLFTLYKGLRGIPQKEFQTFKENSDRLVDDFVLQTINQKDRLPFKVRLYWLQFYGRSCWKRTVATLCSRFFDDLYRLECFYKSKIRPCMGKRK